jgi:hypothetical protein
MKEAVAFWKGDSLYIHSESRTTTGAWIATAPILKGGERVTDRNARLPIAAGEP